MSRFVSLIILVGCLTLSAVGTAQDTKGKGFPLPSEPVVKPSVAVTPAVPAPAADSFLVSNADEFAVIYERLVTAKSFPRAKGHGVAAAKMVNCLFKNTAAEKADFLSDVITNLSFGTDDNYRRRIISREAKSFGDIRNSPQAAQLGAILACKMGDRKFEKLIADFDAAIAELAKKMDKATGGKVMIPTLFQLITVAELMN